MRVMMQNFCDAISILTSYRDHEYRQADCEAKMGRVAHQKERESKAIAYQSLIDRLQPAFNYLSDQEKAQKEK